MSTMEAGATLIADGEATMEDGVIPEASNLHLLNHHSNKVDGDREVEEAQVAGDNRAEETQEVVGDNKAVDKDKQVGASIAEAVDKDKDNQAGASKVEVATAVVGGSKEDGDMIGSSLNKI